LQDQAFREREDLQRLLKESISVIGEELFVLTEEFSHWSEGRRRIDLLAIDKNASLVVIELKRTEDGGHMELQAIRYAAMVSTLTFQQAVSAHADFIESESPEAAAAILAFLGSAAAPDNFGKTVRIVLVSADFSKEITTAVLWLNSNGLDIRCVRIRPYQLDNRTLLEIDQIIPLREAQDYIVRVKEKQQEALLTKESTLDFTRYDLTIGENVLRNLWKRSLMWHVISAAASAGLTVEAVTKIIPARKIIIVSGQLRGKDFHDAARRAKEDSGYVFRPERFFIDDEHLIQIGDKTIAISNQWGLPSLPLIDAVIRAVPKAKISYRETSGA